MQLWLESGSRLRAGLEGEVRTRLPRRRSLHHRRLHARRLCRRRCRPFGHLQRRLRLQDHPRPRLLPRRRRPCHRRRRRRRCLRERPGDLAEHGGKHRVGRPADWCVPGSNGGHSPPRRRSQGWLREWLPPQERERRARRAAASGPPPRRSTWWRAHACACVHISRPTPPHGTPRHPTPTPFPPLARQRQSSRMVSRDLAI